MIAAPGRSALVSRSRKRRAAPDLPSRMIELGTLAPLVAGARLGRMAREGARPSARGRSDLLAMVLEKQVAFAQGWSAMYVEAWRLQAGFALACLATAPSPLRAARLVDAGLQRIATRGLAPTFRRVKANARRLR